MVATSLVSWRMISDVCASRLYLITVSIALDTLFSGEMSIVTTFAIVFF